MQDLANRIKQAKVARAEAVVQIYRTLPELGCKGLCAESCGPIPVSNAESEGLRDKYNTVPTWSIKGTCTALKDNRCSIYEDRPLICRLWGVVEGMPCKFGCVPIGGRLSDREGRKLLARMEAL